MTRSTAERVGASGRWSHRIRRSAAIIVAATLLSAGPVAAAASTPLGCVPGSGPQLREHHFSQSDLTKRPVFRCADLRNADLTGLSLIQVDFTGADLQKAKLAGASIDQATFTGADLSGADLSGADLTQATLTGATFAGTNLAHARMGQAEAAGANFVGADLTGADLSQAELQNANLDDAKLGGTDFTQASIQGASFSGATGQVRWDVYIAIAAIALFVLLAIRLLISVGRQDLAGSSLARRIAVGLLGRLVLVLGLHVFVAGLYGVFASSFGSPVIQMCTGPQCVVGVNRGFWAPFIGVGVIIVGIGIAASARTRTPLPPMALPYSLNR